MIRHLKPLSKKEMAIVAHAWKRSHCFIANAGFGLWGGKKHCFGRSQDLSSARSECFELFALKINQSSF